MYIRNFTNSLGLSIGVRLITEGASYGENNSIIHKESNPLVEFATIPSKGVKKNMVFISRYYLSTFLQTKSTGVDIGTDMDKRFILTSDECKMLIDIIHE